MNMLKHSLIFELWAIINTFHLVMKKFKVWWILYWGAFLLLGFFNYKNNKATEEKDEDISIIKKAHGK